MTAVETVQEATMRTALGVVLDPAFCG